MSAAAPAGGRGGSGRESQQAREGGCAAERATWDRGPAVAPAPPGLCAPRAPLVPPSAPLPARRLGPRVPVRLPPPPRPQPQLAPASDWPLTPCSGDAPSLTSRPRHCSLAVGSPGLASPSERGPSSLQSHPFRVPFPRFFLAGGSPHPASGGCLFTQFCLFFPADTSFLRPRQRPAFPPRLMGLNSCAFGVDPRELAGGCERKRGWQRFSKTRRKLPV